MVDHWRVVFERYMVARNFPADEMLLTGCHFSLVQDNILDRKLHEKKWSKLRMAHSDTIGSRFQDI